MRAYIKLHYSNYYSLFILFYFLFFVEIFAQKIGQEEDSDKQRIESLIDNSKNKNVSIDVRKNNLEGAYQLLQKIEQDSLRVRYLLELVLMYYNMNESVQFKKLNLELLQEAINLNDSISIADYHWNLGSYYWKTELLDSSYYHYQKARRIFEDLDYKKGQGKMEFNISLVLRKSYKYIESEVYTFKAIEKFIELGKKESLYGCYNHLGLLFNDLGNFEKAEEYHLKALDLLSDLNEKSILLERSLNNLSLVYQKQGLYDQAISTLNEALENDSLYMKNPSLYSKVIDNRAYYRFLKGDSLEVFSDYHRALAIKQELNNEAGEVISRLRMAEYYLRYQDSIHAYQEAHKAYQIASEFNLNRDILEALKLLSKAKPENSDLYLARYASLNDSLILEERKVRDKFTRVQFETETYIAKNEALEQKNIWISISSAMALGSFALIFFAYRQKSRNRRLKLERKQQKANEEIYDLMIKQQYKREEGRLEERVRISEELHDGALARLFSVRMGMGYLEESDNKEEREQYEIFMNELKMVEKEIRAISHALKNEGHSTKKDFGLLLEELLEEQSKLGDFEGNLINECDIAWDQVDEKIKMNLFRIVQESLHNIIKYASCSLATIRFYKEHEEIKMEIEDDGEGFKTSKKPKGIGLKNMKSRSGVIGARLSIWSEPNKGSRITISIPTKTLYHDAEE